MKYPTRLGVVVVGLLFSSLSVVAQYTVELPYKRITVKNIGGKAVFDGGFSVAQPGQPSLPAYHISFLLPPDADLEKVAVKIDNLAEKELAGEYMVGPCEILSPESAENSASIVDGKDTAVYRKNAVFPAAYPGKPVCGSMYQYKLATVSVNAYRYNPVTKKLRELTGGTLRVTFSSGSATLNIARSERTEKLLRMRVVNASVFNSYGTLMSTTTSPTPTGTVATLSAAPGLTAATSSIPGHKYLVITTQYIKQNSTQLNSFLNDVVNAYGGDTQVIAVEDEWNGVSGQNRAGEIREYLRDEYNNNPGYITNLLIIGSPDLNNGDIPMTGTGSPTDFYYADMDDPIGNSGEIAVGRIPAVYLPPLWPAGGEPFNMTQIDAILERTKNYCLTGGDAAEWRRLAMLPIVPLGSDENHLSLGENTVIQTIQSNNAHWQFYRLYDPFDYNYKNSFLNSVPDMVPLPEVPYCNPFVVPEKWNDQCPGLVIFNTHGCPSHAIGVLGTNDLGTDILSGLLKPGSISYLDPTYPAVVFGASCHTAPEDMPVHIDMFGQIVIDHMGYEILAHNAVAYIGGSRDIGQYLSIYGSFVDYMTDRSANCSVGDALNFSKVGNSGGGITLLNLWGCPNVAFNLTDLDPQLGRPENLSVVPNTSGNPQTQAIITWNPVPNATAYVIERGDASAKRTGGFNLLIEKASTFHLDNTLTSSTAGVKYKYRVYAKNGSNRGPYSAIDSVATHKTGGGSPVPVIGSMLSGASNMNSGTIVTWNTTPLATYYNIKRSKLPAGPFVTVGTGDNATLSYTDTNLTNSKGYWYCHSAANEFGESNNSYPIYVVPNSPGDGNVAGFTSCGVNAPLPTQGNVNALSFHWVPDGFNYIGTLIEYMELMPDLTTYASVNGSNSWLPVWGEYIIGDRYETVTDNPAIPRECFTNWNYAFSMDSHYASRPRGNVNYKFRIRNFTYPTDDHGVRHYSAENILPCPTSKDDNLFNPEAPTSFSAVQVGPETVKFTWNYSPASQPASTSDIQFRIYYKDTGDPWKTAFDVGSSLPLEQPVIVGMNKNLKCYIKSLYSKDEVDIDGDYSGFITCTTDGVLAKPELYPVVTGSSSICVTFITPKSASADSAQIQRKLGSGGTWQDIVKIDATQTAYVDEYNLRSNREYCYQARYFAGPVGSRTYSDWSDEKCVTIPPSPADIVMGFEDADAWHFVNGTGTLTLNTTKFTQGSASLQITGNGWQRITCSDLNTTEIYETPSALKLDLFVGKTQPNPWWIGQVQLFVNCPSAGLNDVHCGNYELTGLPRGVFSTLSFNLPSNVRSALAGDHDDFTFSVALNTNPGSGPYYFDNMRF